MLDTRMEPAVAQGMLRGAPDALSSAFHLSYTMLLNLLRAGGATPEQLLRASFRQFQTERALPALRARAAALAVRPTLAVGVSSQKLQCLFFLNPLELISTRNISE